MPEEVDTPAKFGIDAFALDDRLRLFHFTAADKRTEYLRVLRAFERARANYQVLLHATMFRSTSPRCRVSIRSVARSS